MGTIGGGGGGGWNLPPADHLEVVERLGGTACTPCVGVDGLVGAEFIALRFQDSVGRVRDGERPLVGAGFGGVRGRVATDLRA